MNIIQCKMCKKPFQSIGSRICPECVQQIDQDFIVVRDYIYEHKGASIDEVAEETEVDKAIIMHLLKEGRLQLLTPGGDGLLMCEMCRKPISSGKLCERCKANLSNTIQHSEDDKKKAVQDKKDLEESKANARLHGPHNK